MNEVTRAMRHGKSSLTTFAVLVYGVLLLTSPAFADAVDQSLVQAPSSIKDRTRTMIENGVPSEEAIQLVQAMNANRFREEQILKSQAIVLEAQGRGLPTKPVIHKAFEGMAKQVAPEQTLQAMEAVSSRYAFAYGQARSITKNTEQAGRLGNLLAESLAAGLKEQDASKIMSQLQGQSPKLSRDQMDDLAAVCLTMARDMSRLNVSSALSSQVISSALSNGLNAAGIASMHQSLVSQSQAHSAQALAQGLAQGMQHGQSEQGLGSTDGGQPGHGGQGGSGGPGGGVGGGGGGAGGGSGGGGGGGGGSGGGK